MRSGSSYKPVLSKVEVIFEGALSRSWSMQDVLKAIMGVDNQPFGVLRISCASSRLAGRVAIADGSYIIGAVASADPQADSLEVGYEAVRKLLSARDGNFAFLDTGGERPSDMDDTLYISIERIASLLPNLPESPAELFDEKSLLDKLFGAGALVRAASPEIAVKWDSSASIFAARTDQSAARRRYSSGTFGVFTGSSNQPRLETTVAPFSRDEKNRTGRPVDPPVPASDATTNSAGTSTPKSARNPGWQLFQPLISNSAVANPQSRSDQSSVAYDIDQTGPHPRQSLTRLRTEPVEAQPWYKEMLRESLLSRSSLMWTGMIILLLLVATLFGTAAVNQHNSLTIQKSSGARTHP